MVISSLAISFVRPTLGTLIVADMCVEIPEQIQQLKASGLQLAELMERAAADLRSSGMSLSMELVTTWQNYRQMFQVLQDRVHEACGNLPNVHGNASTSLAHLEQRFEFISARNQALQFLWQLQQVSHREGPDHPVAAICRRACQRVIDTIDARNTQSQTVTQAINAGRHSLSALWSLLNQHESLNDDEWAERLDVVAEHLGREVATAVARRKLVILATAT